MISGLRRWFSW